MLNDLGRGYIFFFIVVKYVQYKICHLNHLITQSSGIKYIVLNSHLHHPSTELLHLAELNLYPLNNSSPTHSCWSLATTLSLCVSADFTAPGTTNKRTPSAFVFLWWAYFAQHNALKVHPCDSICQNVLPFSGWVTPIVCAYCILLIHSPLANTWIISFSFSFYFFYYCCWEHRHVDTSSRHQLQLFGMCIPRSTITDHKVILFFSLRQP